MNIRVSFEDYGSDSIQLPETSKFFSMNNINPNVGDDIPIFLSDDAPSDDKSCQIEDMFPRDMNFVVAHKFYIINRGIIDISITDEKYHKDENYCPKKSLADLLDEKNIKYIVVPY